MRNLKRKFSKNKHIENILKKEGLKMLAFKNKKGS